MNETSFDPDKHTAQSKQAWSEASPCYDKISSGYFQNVAWTFVEFAGLAPGMSVLDVACGTGLVSIQAADKVIPGGKVLGVDLAPGMLTLARLKAKELHLGAVEFREMNAERLELPDNAFDAVICHLGLMLFARPEAALKEMVRVCKPGGAVSCLVQGEQEKMAFTSLMMRCAVKRAPHLKAPPGAPTLYRYGPPGALEQALKDAGLADVRGARVEDAAKFPSAEAYWESLSTASGRARAQLESLPQETRDAIRADVIAEARKYSAGAGVTLPIEMAMARGVKTS